MSVEELTAEKIMINLDRRLKKIIPGFLENRRQELETLDEACKKKKFKAIEDIGHQLMGSAGSYGFLTLSRLEKILSPPEKRKIWINPNLLSLKSPNTLKT